MRGKSQGRQVKPGSPAHGSDITQIYRKCLFPKMVAVCISEIEVDPFQQDIAGCEEKPAIAEVDYCAIIANTLYYRGVRDLCSLLQPI